MGSDPHEPRRQSSGLTKPRQFGKQLQKHFLKDLACLIDTHSILQGDRKNQIPILVDQKRPRVVASIDAFPDEIFILPGSVRFLHTFRPCSFVIWREDAAARKLRSPELRSRRSISEI